jgi:hypothetical protein
MEYSATLVIVPSSTRETYFRTIRIHGTARSSIPIETSRTSSQRSQHMLLAGVQFRRSIESCGITLFVLRYAPASGNGYS